MSHDFLRWILSGTPRVSRTHLLTSPIYPLAVSSRSGKSLTSGGLPSSSIRPYHMATSPCRLRSIAPALQPSILTRLPKLFVSSIPYSGFTLLTSTNRLATSFCLVDVSNFPTSTSFCATAGESVGSGRLQADVDLRPSGTIPYLARRIAYASNAPMLKNPISPPEIITQFKTFHYDTASVGFSPELDLAIAFIPEDKLVIGTDHPYAPTPMIVAFAKGVNDWEFGDVQKKRVFEGNARALFPRLA